jgi:hypothetical protein
MVGWYSVVVVAIAKKKEKNGPEAHLFTKGSSPIPRCCHCHGWVLWWCGDRTYSLFIHEISISIVKRKRKEKSPVSLLWLGATVVVVGDHMCTLFICI